MTNSAGQQKILLVEDNPLSRELAFSFLEEAGFACTAAANGEKAIELLRNSDFDLVLMDIEMPVMDGVEATRKIRSELQLTLPIIAFTAHRTEAEHQKFIALGMNACITKPLQEEKLIAAINNQLNSPALTKPVLHVAAEVSKGVVDLTYLHKISIGKKDFFKSMIVLFLEQNSQDMELLRKAVQDSDFKSVRQFSHKIKVSIGFMGLEKHIEAQLVEMEELAEKSAQPEKVKQLFATVDSVCNLAVAELTTFLENQDNL